MPRYSIPINTNITLTANTARTIIAVSTSATRRARLCGFEFGFDSVVGTDNSVLWEIVRSDATTAGTATSTTPVPVDQGETAALCSGFTAYTAEPTVLTVLKSDRCTPVGRLRLLHGVVGIVGADHLVLAIDRDRALDPLDIALRFGIEVLAQQFLQLHLGQHVISPCDRLWGVFVSGMRRGDGVWPQGAVVLNAVDLPAG